ncbi:MAG: tripartite tricarboxylate transporter substrate binding protein [Candidatus Parcubacteria bacterium]|nr:tripartite tricarboxylate transporter substrate binding protein [Burkholderiales bacterium]
MNRAIIRGLAASLLLVLAGAAWGQAYPGKPVRIIIPFSPGGSADAQARLLGQKLTELWGQPVLIESKPGAGTTIGAAFAAQAAPDGYTLYLAGASLLISGSLYKNLSYDPVKSFAPVSMLASSPYVLAVHPAVKAATLQELVALAKAKPKGVSYGSAGNGSGSHLAGELFRMLTGAEFLHVPYKGQAPALVALAGGEIDFLFADVAVLPLLQAGKLRALAETGLRRSPLLPAMPLAAESGASGYEMINWGAILAPAGTPRAIVNHVNAAINGVVLNAEVKQRFNAQGFEPMGSTPEALLALLQSESAKYARVIRESGMKIE